jgi:hypothetical protein
VKIEKEREEEVSSKQTGQAKKTGPPIAMKTVEPSLPTVRSESSTKSPGTPALTDSGHPRPVEKQKPTNISELSKRIPAVHSDSDSSVLAKKDNRLLAAKLPSPIATEEEVKKLFNHYVERYNTKDTQGFLSLFSAKAVQNQKDRLEGIRRIYENFFYQSLELRYSVEDMKVDIYQNGVDVKARYEVDQVSRKDGERNIWKGNIQWMLIKEDGVLKIISLNYKHDGTP